MGRQQQKIILENLSGHQGIEFASKLLYLETPSWKGEKTTPPKTNIDTPKMMGIGKDKSIP